MLQSCNTHALVTFASKNMMENKRQRRRDNIELIVHIETGYGPSVACLMSDISEAGARLKISNLSALPDEFMLLLKAGLRRWCKIQWRSKNQVGVKFLQTPRSQIAQPPITQNIKSPLEGDPTKEVWLLNVVLPAGTESKFHRHPGDRWITVQEGELVFSIKGEDEKIIKVGESLYIPRGTIHRDRSVSDKPVRTVEFLILDRDKPKTEIVE